MMKLEQETIMSIQYMLSWLRVNHWRRLLIRKGSTLLFDFLLVLNQYTRRTAPGLEAVATYSSAEAITFAQIGSLACENQTVKPTALSYGIKTALEEIYISPHANISIMKILRKAGASTSPLR